MSFALSVQSLTALAQTSERCFPQTGFCISGRLRAFWEQNGGLPVFGFPITPQREEIIEGQPLQVQWFERNRLELHPENAAPYDVLLGRSGADRLNQQGRDWFQFPKSTSQAGCRFFPATGHNVCGAILQAWRASGLEFDGRRGKSEAENLALFGLPLSEVQTETIEGKDYQVQWFERGRFELHPENASPYNVLLGLLGNEIGAATQAYWRQSIAQIPQPKQGCFTATYPTTDWQEVACVTAPDYPMPPRDGPRPLVVGSGNDISPQAPTGFISTAIGSFATVTNVTSESSPIGNTGAPVANAYTLQVNTNFFTGTACTGSPNAGCRGWEQFVFENTGTIARAFIQYWLIKFNAPCPAGQSWNQFQFTGSTDIYCFKNNSGGAVPVTPIQPITSLASLSLSGTVSATADSVTFFVGSTAFSRNGDNAVNAAAGWQAAEFNVFGDGGSSAGGGGATFNIGATIVPRTRIIYGGIAAPTCTAQGFTGETNNLSFGPTAPAASAPGPALLFTESSAGGAPSNCAAATGVGDTHLTTFNGLLYDFQASGDFILAQRGPDFEVQTRQVSGAPTWPDAAVNNAVATRMGKTNVAICLAPTRLNIDGKTTDLRDGDALSLPDGVDVSRRGNVYFVTGADGDSVRAVVNSSWIDVAVGLGVWPAEVRGLLANANGKVDAIEASDGTVLSNPFPFEELYHHYADSWRVPEKESLLSVCGEARERGIPKRPFYAKDLDPQLAERTRALCVNAGVKEGALLDACTLDVAVIGKDAAANVFVGAPPPIAIGSISP